MTQTLSAEQPQATESVDRQTSIPGTALSLSASLLPPDAPPKRKRGRPPKDPSLAPQDALAAKLAELRKLQEREDELKLQIAAEEKRRKTRQPEIVGRVVIAEMKRSENVAKLVRAMLVKAGLNPADRADVAQLLLEGGAP
jgi:hypothetical protein